MAEMPKLIRNRFGESATWDARQKPNKFFVAELVFDLSDGKGIEGLIRSAEFPSEEAALNSLEKHLRDILGEK